MERIKGHLLANIVDVLPRLGQKPLPAEFSPITQGSCPIQGVGTLPDLFLYLRRALMPLVGRDDEGDERRMEQEHSQQQRRPHWGVEWLRISICHGLFVYCVTTVSGRLSRKERDCDNTPEAVAGGTRRRRSVKGDLRSRGYTTGARGDYDGSGRWYTRNSGEEED